MRLKFVHGSVFFLCFLIVHDLLCGIDQVWREKNILKPAPGKRQCNCRNEVYHKQIGPGMFQQMTEQVYNASTNSAKSVFWRVSLIFSF